MATPWLVLGVATASVCAAAIAVVLAILTDEPWVARVLPGHLGERHPSHDVEREAA